MPLLNSVKFYAKLVVLGFLIAGAASYALVAMVILKIAGKNEYTQYVMARAFHFLVSHVLGIKIVIKNEERLLKTPAVVISNHQSIVDLHILGRVFMPGYTVTAKKALKYIPILGWVMAGSGAFFLDRSKGEKAKAVLNQALVQLKKDDRALFIFPEGTRSATKKLDLLPFKKGAFHLAKQAKIPIIPVAVSNYSTLFNSRDKTFNRGTIIIDVLPPVSTEDVETNDDVTELTLKVRDQIQASIESMGYAPVRGQPVKKTQVEAKKEAATSVDKTDTDIEVISEATPLVK